MIYSAMIRQLLQVPLIAVLVLLVLGSSNGSDKRPLLRALDGMTSLVPTAGPRNITNCVVVMPDGRFYLLLKRQETGDSATVKSFEGSLDQRQLLILHNLLDESTIKSAPNYDIPRMPSFDEWQGFEAQIDRGSTVQHVGYLKWKVEGANNEESANKDSQESEVALQPLVEWFRALKTYKEPLKRPASKTAHFSCDLDNDAKD
jgi:hypothetical protein